MPARRPLAVMAVAAALLLAAAPNASAHTEPDVVAVPAGAPATVTLKPNHGCGDSPTTKVSTRVPAAGARGAEVPGWTVSSVDDGEGRTVIDWTGGSLGAEEIGAFPVEFTAPGDVGKVLTFPFIQECANGEELVWIDGDPAGEYPAPRLLILAAGSAPAESIEDVPADAPGRAELIAIVDVDGQVGPTTTSEPQSTDTSEPATTSTGADGGNSDSSGPIIAGAIAVLGLVVGAIALRRRRGTRTSTR